MGLIVNDKREVDWPVTINVPVDGGKTEKHEIIVRFELATSEEFLNGGNEPAGTLLQRKVKGWGTEEEHRKDGLMLSEDEPMPFTGENLKAVLKIGYIERAFTTGLIGASNGAAAKN